MAQPHITHRNNTLKELIDNFGKTLNIDTIQDVAKQNDYDAYKSTLALVQISASNNNSMPSIRRPGSVKVSRIPNPENYVSTFAVEDAIDDILRNYKVLILLRGLPGSGKSFLGKSILKASLEGANHSEHIFSADDFFSRSGRYVYDISKIDEAHNWTRRNLFQKMLQGYSPLIVDNTNIRLWEMKQYAIMAAQCGYKIHILEVNTKWSFDCKELAKRNQHAVAKAKIRTMLDKYDKNITPEGLLSGYNLPLKYQMNPQQRNYPPVVNIDNYISYRESSVSTSGVHNHNSRNRDLKLPNSGQNMERNASTAHYSQSEVSNIIEISDDENADFEVTTPPKSAGSFPPQNFDYAAWGVDESVLKSWDFVSPLKDIGPTTLNVDPNHTIDFNEKPHICNNSSNTCMEDFHRESEGSQVLYGRYRNINPSGKKLPLNKPGMLDRGCSTQDDIISDRNEDLKKLIDIFQSIPPLYIRDMYDDCKGDFDMTFEIFLEDNKEYSHIPFTKDNIISNDEEFNHPKKSKHSNDEPLQYLEQGALLAASTCEQKSPQLNDTLSQSRDPCDTTYMNGYYSAVSANYSELPSTCKITSSNTHEIKSAVDDFIIIDSDSDLESDICSSQAESEDNDIIELNLGVTLTGQLEKQFGDPETDYPKGFQPVVQVPKTFARQLYAFYVESVYQQMEAQKNIMDKLVQEDEAFARKLYEKENGLSKEPQLEGLRDIQNEQIAMNIQEREITQENCTPDDLATHLTKKKLFATFPTVERAVLLQIFDAYGQDYNQTVEDLLVSVDPREVQNTNPRDPPISQTVLLELEKAFNDFGTVKEEDDNNRSSESYREEANEYLNKRTELYHKAQEYYSHGHREVAQFYSQLAQKQTQFYDMANNRAATILLEEHSRRLQNFDTIDLHYLFVKEAIPALDLFIDRNINLLKGGTKMSQNLLVITGRGNRSKNGVSRIKPAVISRLKTRKIQFVQLNPGLLKIKVNRNTIITSDL